LRQEWRGLEACQTAPQEVESAARQACLRRNIGGGRRWRAGQILVIHPCVPVPVFAYRVSICRNRNTLLVPRSVPIDGETHAASSSSLDPRCSANHAERLSLLTFPPWSRTHLPMVRKLGFTPCALSACAVSSSIAIVCSRRAASCRLPS